MRTVHHPPVPQVHVPGIPPVVRDHRTVAAVIVAMVVAAVVVVSITVLRSGDEGVESRVGREPAAGVVAPSEASPVVLSQAQLADAARWTGLAEAYGRREGLTVGQLADAARWTGLAEAYGRREGLTVGQLADAARWTALAESYGDRVQE